MIMMIVIPSNKMNKDKDINNIKDNTFNINNNNINITNNIRKDKKIKALDPNKVKIVA